MSVRQRSAVYETLSIQKPSEAGSAPDTAVIAPRYPRRSVRRPVVEYVATACSRNVSIESCSRTVTFWP
jgi:hypothetical protein